MNTRGRSCTLSNPARFTKLDKGKQNINWEIIETETPGVN